MIEPASQDFYITVMKDILIYAGLAVLLAGALLGLYIALKGFFGSNKGSADFSGGWGYVGV